MQKGDVVRIRQDDSDSRRYWSYWVRVDPTLADATIIVEEANIRYTFRRLDGKLWPDGTEMANSLAPDKFISIYG